MNRPNETLDGAYIEAHEGAVKGTFELDYGQAMALPYDAETMLVIAGRVTVPRYKESKTNGTITTVHVVEASHVAVITNLSQRRALSEQLGFEVPLELDLAPIETPVSISDVPQDLDEQPDEFGEPTDEVRLAEYPAAGLNPPPLTPEQRDLVDHGTDFFEEDEPVEKVLLAFEQGQHEVTGVRRVGSQDPALQAFLSE